MNHQYGAGHVYGYGRVSTLDQSPALQLDALTAAGCERIFRDKASGKLDRRPELDKLLEALLPGDTALETLAVIAYRRHGCMATEGAVSESAGTLIGWQR